MMALLQYVWTPRTKNRNKQNHYYVNLAALVSYILGRILHSNFLIAFGLTIMAGLSIWTIIHWKENDKMSNYISVAFLVLVGLSLFGL